MAKIEKLIDEIADPRVRGEIAAEVKRLKAMKRFGLVFEEHLPETVRLPGLPVRVNELVAERALSGSDVWVVKKLNRTTASCSRPEKNSEKCEREFAASDLVVVKRFGEAIYPAIVPVDRVNRGGDKPWHSLINSDNFHALQLLLYCYEGQVDLIYIDPPYNTGAKDWRYNNDYVDKSDLWRHSKWLSMMKKRLELAKRLLKFDGVLVVTIDEHEVHHLGMLLEQIFPAHLRQMLSVVINPKGTGKLNFARTDEYLLYCVPNTGTSLVSAGRIVQGRVEEPDEKVELFSDNDDEEAGEEDDNAQEELALDTPDKVDRPFPEDQEHLWELRHGRRRGNESSYRHQRPNQFYPLLIDSVARKVVHAGEALPLGVDPDFKKVKGLTPVWPIDEEGNQRCWRFIPESMNLLIGENRVVLGRFNKKRGTWTVNYWVRKTSAKKVKTVWWNTSHDAGTHGTTLLHRILGRRDAFPFPKSIHAVRDTIATVCANRPNALIVDFFAGSGTTYHATCMLNAEDGGRRRCILVSNNEVSDKRAKDLAKKGFLPGDPDYEKEGISEAVAWPRCKFITNGKRDDGTPLEGRFAVDGPLKGRANADGFEENIEYYRVNFLEPSSVAMGLQFQSILPLLWMRAGNIGERESSKGSTPWYLPKNSPYAVLIKEQKFPVFRKEITKRKDLTHVYLVTDSDENFRTMARALSHKFRVIQLYRSYLENFKINIDLLADA